MALAFIAGLSTSASLLLIVCLLAVCLFEAINGFHDTANAVATVIYTHTLHPMVAVVWSGIWNFLGVMLGGIAVAMSVVKLIPLNELLVQSLGENISLVLAVLISAIAWNLATWYFGIPCSSSHTLIGALLGSGFGFWLVHQGAGVNWGKAAEIGISLLISPFFGFSLSILLMYLLRIFVKKKTIFKEPKAGTPPPPWIRAILLLTCTLVSFFHGSNDGQKGVGLLMMVLVAFLPIKFALNHNVPIKEVRTELLGVEQTLRQNASGDFAGRALSQAQHAYSLAGRLDTLDLNDKSELFGVRTNMEKFTKTLQSDVHLKILPAASMPQLKKSIRTFESMYKFAPTWVIILVSFCLGIGTMIGWKRIVITIGEKIGKTHLAYAQGASAEICAAATIGVSTAFGLPVSTTHVLSSGVAGTMVASGGIKNLQKKTITNIAMAWLLTLPVSFVAAFGLFNIFRLFF